MIVSGMLPMCSRPRCAVNTVTNGGVGHAYVHNFVFKHWTPVTIATTVALGADGTDGAAAVAWLGLGDERPQGR